MNWSRGLFRAWMLGSTLWLVGWSAHLLLEWPRPPAETAASEAVKRKSPAEPLTDDETKYVAFLRLTDQWSVVNRMLYGIDADQPIHYLMKVEDECFILTQSYIDTFVENAALEIKPDRTLMLRYEFKGSLCQHGYRTDALSHFYDIHGENVSNHIVMATVAAFGIPAISLALGWAILWARLQERLILSPKPGPADQQKTPAQTRARASVRRET